MVQNVDQLETGVDRYIVFSSFLNVNWSEKQLFFDSLSEVLLLKAVSALDQKCWPAFFYWLLFISSSS
jgi:hypothetical protein